MTNRKKYVRQVRFLFIVAVISMCSLMLNGCNKATKPTGDKTIEITSEKDSGDDMLTKNVKESSDRKVDSSGMSEQSEGNQQTIEEMAKKIVDEMTIDEKVYQMFIVLPEQLTGVGQVTAAGTTTQEALEKYPVGGILYLSQNIVSRNQTQTMLSNVQAYSKIPVFTAVDEEGGVVSRVGNNPNMGTTSFPSMKNIGSTGDSNQAYTVGYTIGNECKELGFNLDFAPVADVFSNPENTVIGNRAFSDDPNITADMVSSCVRGFKDAKMLCALKHFPGHGDTIADSHYEAAITSKTLEELDELEFVPFVKGIEAGADFVMVGHILTPNITDDYIPATLSNEMLSILRDELKFDGIIITDAMNMAAITDYYSSSEAAVTAVKAGIDMILVPEDFHAAVSGVMHALETGDIAEEEINDSVIRIIQTKIRAGLSTE
ncbi:glycoside hydrolase family 3 protein [Bariatricus sp. HCP28S3_E4]|uniref:glycoside hydrolase family 3 protein n=1 Tax=unclassified Bariatricus TaxID=2677046 RepID=UPI003F8A83CE